MEKDIRYRLTADPLHMEKGFKSAEDSARALERELARLEAEQRRVHNAMDTAGRTFLAGGAAIAAGLGLATKAAISWESAWTGVAKVVDGTPEQMAALEAEIRGLTQILPQSHAEIAAVAAAAGQLGVKRQDIAEFTKTMVMMGTATNLASDEAAVALARMMNIMQTAPSDVDRLGSAIVGLGNNFATTESEIVAMALRIAGAGNTIRMSEADVLGYAAALSSVGIEAEAGGTAISTAFIKIETAVRAGGKELQAFATVAGMTAEDFQRAYEQDSARAIAAFVQGLGRIQKSGGDVFATLESLEMGEIRLRDAMLRLAGAGDTLTTALDIANESWDENAALIEEAERRYGTVEARMQIARNSINDLAIDIGQTLLPVVGEAADAVNALGAFFGSLPDPVQDALVVLGSVAAILLLIGGTALITVPKIAAYREAVEILANSHGRLATMVTLANTAMSRVGSFLMGPWGIAIGVAITALTLFGLAQGQADAKANDLSRTLDEQTGAVTHATRAWIAHDLEQRGALAAAQALGIDLATLVDAILGEADAIDVVNEKLKILEERQMGQRGPSKAQAEATQVKTAMEELGHALEIAQAGFDRTEEAVYGTGTEMSRLDPRTRQLADALGLSADKAKDFNKELEEMDKELEAIFDRIFGLQNAQDDLQDAIDALTEGIRRQREAGDANAGSFVGMSKAARENRDALQEVLEKLAALTMETIEQTGSTEEAYKVMDDFEAQMREVAEALGIDIEKVDGYNDAVAEIERQIQVRFDVQHQEAKARIDEFIGKLSFVPRFITVRLQTALETIAAAGSGRAGGGWVWGPPGVDNVLTPTTPGEFVVNAAAARENRAVLEAINAGARVSVGAMAGGATAPVTHVDRSIHIHPATAQFGVHELRLVLAQQEAVERAGRPR